MTERFAHKYLSSWLNNLKNHQINNWIFITRWRFSYLFSMLWHTQSRNSFGGNFFLLSLLFYAILYYFGLNTLFLMIFYPKCIYILTSILASELLELCQTSQLHRSNVWFHITIYSLYISLLKLRLARK